MKILQSLGDRGNIYIDEDGRAQAELWEEYKLEDDQEFADDECSNSTDDGWCRGTRAQHTVEAGGTGEDVSAEACEEFERERDRTRFFVYRFDLDRCSMLDDGRIVPYGFPQRTDLPHPIDRYEEWFSRDLDKVARSADTTRAELAEALCSTDPTERFWAYENIGSYHGFDNFDSYPLDLSERELRAREDARDAAERAVKEAANKRHRFVQLVATPHGLCERSKFCVEHRQNKKIPSCKRGKGRRVP